LKILVAGAWFSAIHESALAGAFERLGHEVVRFPWQPYFAPAHEALSGACAAWLRFQDKYLWGPRFTRLNHDLLALAQREQPDLLFVYRGTHITPRTLAAVKSSVPRCVLASYNNDDPFGPAQPPWYWRHFVAALARYDLALAYRRHNLAEFQTHGAKRVELLRSWYIPAQNRRIPLSDAERERYECDVVFVGHYEADHRVACLEEVVRRGWRLKLFGPGYEWDAVLRDNPLLKHLVPVQLVWQDDYNRALSGAKAALCFLSKLNRDTYTRRCFEIPATGALLLSERTSDLQTLFAEDGDAAYFSDAAELGVQLDRYLRDDALRERVAANGHARLLRDGHDVDARARKVLGWVEQIRGDAR
jgi:hypothetical protein